MASQGSLMVLVSSRYLWRKTSLLPFNWQVTSGASGSVAGRRSVQCVETRAIVSRSAPSTVFCRRCRQPGYIARVCHTAWSCPALQPDSGNFVPAVPAAPSGAATAARTGSTGANTGRSG